MSQTLYRKYRPKKFTDVAGQEHIVATLLNQVKQGSVAHAYLFVGPRGVGKTTTARLFAATVESKGDADLAEEILSGRDIDVIEIDAASYSKVENVREIILENVRVTPAKRPYKIFIIDEVHMLSSAAFNALLKVIEEPPAHVIFILATTELHKVPATIISRCQRFDFKRISNEVAIEVLKMVTKAEGVKVGDDVLEQIVRHADGSLRDAESILGQLFAIGQKEITMEQASAILPPSLINQSIDLLSLLADKKVTASLEHLNSLVEQGLDLNQLCHDILEICRQMMLVSNGVARKNFAPASADLAKRFSPEELLRLINLISSARLGIKQSYLPQLPLEVAIVQFCTMSPSVNAPLQQIVPPSRPSTPSAPIQPPQSKPEPVKPAVKLEVVKSASQLESVIPVEKKPLVEPAQQEPSNPPVAGTLTIERVRSTWHKFLSALQEVNASLVLILKTAEPMKIVGNKLYIGFKYPFHRDRVNSNDVRTLLEDQIGKYFGQPMLVANEMLPADYSSEFLMRQSGADEVELVADTMSAANASLFVAPNPAVDSKVENSTALIEHLVSTFGGRILET